ncbi:hypothetical protein PFISCL1PPCAC_3320, partial [Pristionchus fissidentatus]
LKTFQCRSLRSTCNILIGVCALADIFNLVGYLYQLPILLNYSADMDSVTCNMIVFLPVMGVNTGCVCILSIGIDRLFTIVASVKYRSIDKRFYHAV